MNTRKKVKHKDSLQGPTYRPCSTYLTRETFGKITLFALEISQKAHYLTDVDQFLKFRIKYNEH